MPVWTAWIRSLEKSSRSHRVPHVTIIGRFTLSRIPRDQWSTRPNNTGREFDAETGLYYYRARYYDSTNGRFISEDPIGFNGDGPNFYAYVRNSPVDWIDPTGLFAELICEPVPTLRGGWKNAFFLLISRARHCYIHVKCRDYNVTIELTGPTPQDPSHGVPTISPVNPNRGGMHIPINVPAGYKCCQFEDNLLINFLGAGSNLPIYSGYPGPNSNGFAYQVITGAGGSVEMPPTAYGWDYLPPAPTSPAPQH